MKTLCLILGDQLNVEISSLKDFDKKNDVVLMCEVWEEATYVKHHKKKIAFLFSCMRHFSKELKKKKYPVDYIELDAKANTQSFKGEVSRAIKRHRVKQVIVTHPGEYRVLCDIQSWEKEFDVKVDIRPDTRFLSSLEEFEEWANSRKNVRMEYFYRHLRSKHKILMQNNKPIEGKWNFDKENRRPPTEKLKIPKPFTVSPDKISKEVIALVKKKFRNHFGDLNDFHFAVTRKHALAALSHFIKKRLPLFGDYQDAMLQDEPWMFHSHLSLYLNCGLLNPLECIQAAELAYKKKRAPINAVEGFIRQILGWREFVRGIYWVKMPKYANNNFLNAKLKLPEFYWTAETKMNCMKQCINETKQNAHAHHIQRLMVLGNFALLAGIDPKEVNEWYLIVYADAYEWVELPNVTGMTLFADGGFLASKPYAASGAYINKMSNYCKQCDYKVQEKLGGNACPFNYLYWNFILKNRKKLAKNARMKLVFHTLDKMSNKNQKEIKRASRVFLKKITE